MQQHVCGGVRAEVDEGHQPEDVHWPGGAVDLVRVRVRLGFGGSDQRETTLQHSSALQHGCRGCCSANLCRVGVGCGWCCGPCATATPPQGRSAP
eukprot:scaffold99588_cov48-Phaeocystis_antarctica.AAC.3